MFLFLIVLGSAIWIYYDANKNNIRHGFGSGLSWVPNRGPLGWFFLTLILWIYFFPVYLIFRSRLIEDNSWKDASGVVRFGDSKKCPFCAETIKEEAKVCRFCGKDLPAFEASLKPEKKIIKKTKRKTKSNSRIFILGAIAGVVLVRWLLFSVEDVDDWTNNSFLDFLNDVIGIVDGSNTLGELKFYWTNGEFNFVIGGFLKMLFIVSFWKGVAGFILGGLVAKVAWEKCFQKREDRKT